MTPRMQSIRRRAGMLFVWLFLCHMPLDAQTPGPSPDASEPATVRVDEQALQRKQQDQQRARELARKLIESTLESQLAQLRENGLQEMPIYGDIQTMHENIERLVETEMAEVVDLLAAAQDRRGAVREAKFVEARQRIRDVIATLSVERHNLLRRLKTAEVAEQVRRLIALQNAALSGTRELPNQARSERESRALRLIEDERDVRELFLHLVEALADVRTWGGPISQGATDGLRVLKASETGSHLDEAVSTLGQAAFADSADHQQQVVFGLQRLLEVLARTQGLIDSEHADAQRKLQELVQQQTELREATRQSNLDDEDIESLVTRQQQLQRDLARVSEQLAETPEQERLWDQAQQAAQMASIQLFDADRPEAVESQGRVLGSLAALLELFNAAAPGVERDLSAEEYAGRIQRLEYVRSELQEIRGQQASIAETAAETPLSAAELEQAVAESLRELSGAEELPDAVASSLQQASDASRSAAQTLADAAGETQTSDGATQAATAEVQAASVAMEHAAAQVNEALADARRAAIAVRIGELARAAEALERAAAAEHEVARTTSAARRSGEFSPAAAAEIHAIQSDVSGVAEKTADGLKTLAPDAVATLQAVAEQSRQIAAAVGQPSLATDEDAALARAAQMAGENAEQLAGVAHELRSRIQKAAAELVSESEDQLESVTSAQEAVSEVPQTPLMRLTDQLARLQAAREQTRAAAALQERAAGRPDAARVMERAQAIEQALQAQRQARIAARRAESGATLTPLDAVTAQQAVAEQLETLATAGTQRDTTTASESAQRPEAEAATSGAATLETSQEQAGATPLLEAARREAERAAQALLDRDYARAGTARAAADRALQQALQQARRDVESARSTSPAQPPDPTAQRRVAELAATAQQLAAPVPLAAQTLQQAATAAGEAARELAEQSSDMSGTVTQRQQSATEALAEADAQLKDAIGALSGEMQAALHGADAELVAATEQAAQTHAGATSALQAAQQAAQPAAASEPRSDPEAAAADGPATDLQNTLDPETAVEATERLQEALQRAGANLAAREQQIQRDRAIAQALGELAVNQQRSAEDIHAQRANLETLAQAAAEAAASDSGQSGPNAAAVPDSPELRQALRDLSRAAGDFARSQQLTGEGAAEVSGQEQIANLPLRAALQQASRLPSFEPGIKGAGEMQGPVPADPTVEIPNDANVQNTAQGSPSAPGQEGRNGQSAASGQTGQAGQDSASVDAETLSDAQQREAGQDEAGQSPRDLGTGVIPQSPQVTANMMAGTQYGELIEAAGAAVAEAAAEPAGEGGQPGTDSSAQSPPSGDPTAAPGPADGGGSQRGQETPNGQLADGPLREPPEGREPETGDPGDRRGDASLSARRFQQQPWFAKLPPELRQALRANATQRAPRAYEERLRRYFESIDTPE